MLSKRDFVAIVMMMVALLFMFQFSQVVKQQGNNYDVNEFAGESADGEKTDTARLFETLNSESAGKRNNGTVWFVGDRNSGTAMAAEQWSYYRKYKIRYFDDIPEADNSKNVKMIIFDTPSINLDNRTVLVKRLAEKMGSVLVFNGIPDRELINGNKKLRELFGITEIGENTQIEGIQMFEGFLIGGEVILKAQNDEEKKYEDLEMNIPWVKTGLGTKTYMVGLMDEKKVFPYDFPKILWRNYYHGAFVFAVNGDYIDGNMGMGFLDAMTYESERFSLYPVVNANSISVADFPYLSNENNDKMESVYSRDVETMLRDIVWPGFMSMVTRSDMLLSCFFTTKYNYDDPAQPMSAEIPFYLQQMKEINSEAGLSLAFTGDISTDEKIKQDVGFYGQAGTKYEYRLRYSDCIDDEDLKVLKNNGFTSGSISCREMSGNRLLRYLDKNITGQTVTNVASNYSFRDELVFRSVISSLGYSNLLIDMNNVVWPESIDDEWQNYFDRIYSNMTSYWSDSFGFAKTTLSESDLNFRKMYAADFDVETDKEDNNRIIVNMKGTEDAWFVLRTHNAAIGSISHGEYEEIGDYVYLIRLESGQTVIELDDTDDVFRYRNPF